jgi:undecaprenyl-diphosphatase
MHLHGAGDASFDVFIRLGTFGSVVVVYAETIRKIAGALLRAAREPGKFPEHFKKSEHLRLAVYLFAGSVPAAVCGLLFSGWVESMFEDPKFVSDMLLITGAFLFFTRLSRRRAGGDLTLGKSVGIGCAQAAAILPGISRSGVTIGSGLMLGVSKERAAEFSFLMSLPAIFGATLLRARHLVGATPELRQLEVIAVGALVAFVAGYVALRFLLLVLKRGNFSIFAYYCVIVGILGIVFVE